MLRKQLLSGIWLLFCHLVLAQGRFFYNQGEKIPLLPLKGYDVAFYKTEDVLKNDNALRKGKVADGVFFSIQKGGQKENEKNDVQLLYVAGNDTIMLLDRFVLKATPDFLQSKVLPYIHENDARIIDTLLYQVYVVQAKSVEDALDLSNSIYEKGWAIWAQPDYVSLTVRQSSWASQYYISQGYDNQDELNVEIDKAWQITKGCSDIRVAVIDWGVEQHPDLRDAQGNSRVLQGYDAYPGHPLVDAHGTACAGIIAASHTDNMRGIAPNVKIVPIRIGVEGVSSLSETELAAAIRWACDDGKADILSNSWIRMGYSEPLREAIQQAQIYGRGGNWQTGKAGLGSIVVFSSGNYGADLGVVNTCSRYAISVGAITRDGILAEYSQTGPELDLVGFAGARADKGDIYTLDLVGSAGYDKGNYTSTFSGTSAACPQVSGICALILSVNPNLTRLEVEQILYENTIDLGVPGRDNSYGYGLVNAFDAVMDAVRTLSSVDLEVKSGQLVKVSENVDFFPSVGARNLAATYYKADKYKATLTLPYETNWAWMEGDGVSSATMSNEQTYLGIEHSGGNTLLTTYYFYVKSTRLGQEINQWFPVNPSVGNKFLVRKLRSSILNLNTVVRNGEEYEATATAEINLVPGFEVEQGGTFSTEIGPDIDEEAFGCH